MNHNQRYRWLRNRLERWGDWRRRGVKGLGYPSMTADARLYSSPGRSTKGNLAPEYEPDSDAIELEEAIRNRLESNLEIALWFQYVQRSHYKVPMKYFELDSRHRWYAMIERAERELARVL